MDAKEFVEDPSWENAGYLGLSLLSEIPFLKGLKAAKAAKAAKAMNKYNDAVKVYNKAADRVRRMENTPGLNPKKTNQARQDLYKAYSDTTINSLTACNSGLCYGHAMDETYNWNGDSKTLLSAVTPWFRRGGINNSTVGIFAYNPVGGHAANHTATRSVLVSSSGNNSIKKYIIHDLNLSFFLHYFPTV